MSTSFVAHLYNFFDMAPLRQLSIFLISTLLSHPSLSETDQKNAIMETVEKFFLAIEEKDRALLESILIPGSLNISSSELPDGNAELSEMNYDMMVSALTRPGRTAKERAWNETILIQGHIAVFWAPYDFHVNGQFTHCGIDSFQLVKNGNQWLISNASWTRETQNCPQSPLGSIQK